MDLNSALPTMLLLLPGRVHTPLHCAVYSGSLKTVETLLTRGAEIEGGVETDSSTPLYLASWLGFLDIVEALIEHGANVNAKGGLHDRPLQAACSWGHAQVAQRLLDAGAHKDVSGGIDGSALCAAAKRGDADLCVLLLARDFEINFSGNGGWTASHVASEAGCKDVVKLLLRHEASVDAKTADGQTALHWAAARRHKEIIELLLQHGDSANFDLVEMTNVVETFELSWKDLCDSMEFTDEDDIESFHKAHDQSEVIRETLHGALALRSMPYWLGLGVQFKISKCSLADSGKDACEDLLHASTPPQVETARKDELAKCRGNERWPPSPPDRRDRSRRPRGRSIIRRPVTAPLCYSLRQEWNLSLKKDTRILNTKTIRRAPTLQSRAEPAL